MTLEAFHMTAASLVEVVGPAEPEQLHDPYYASPALQLRHLNELLAVQRAFFAEAGLPDRIGIGDLIDYFEVRRSNPAFGIEHTTPGNLTLWLFLLIRALQPQVAVESGVFMGSSLFTQRCASPRHKQFAFDLDFSRLAFRDDSIDYRQHDWGTDDVRAEGPNDLCYFNDHINNCMRIRQCYERGFKQLVLDDTPDFGEIQAYRFPSVPTVGMIANDKLRDGDTLEWIWNGYRLRYTFQTAHTFGAKALIDHCHPIPNIRRWTGLQDSNAYYVKLK
ncbi:MAG: hypothetical protein HY060_04135 [Proteobacteria bacterium]|nr:hypothetical protein [Pseudomonadota bacterium]